MEKLFEYSGQIIAVVVMLLMMLFVFGPVFVLMYKVAKYNKIRSKLEGELEEHYENIGLEYPLDTPEKRKIFGQIYAAIISDPHNYFDPHGVAVEYWNELCARRPELTKKGINM